MSLNLTKIMAIIFIAKEMRTFAKTNTSKKRVTASDVTENIKDEHLKAEEYSHAAVSSDITQCSTVGKNILKRGGSAVDAAIATLLCLGTVQFPYSGIGGGGFMLAYSRTEQRMYAFDYKETIPSNINKTVLEEHEKKKEYGGLSVAVPGEIKGFVSAWKKFGKLKWSELVQPSIRIANEGFNVSEPPTALSNEDIMKGDKNLRKLVLKQEKPEIIWKSFIRRPDYAKTLEKIRDDPESMYEGELAETIVSDIQKKGGVMTLDDLKNYKMKMREPIRMKLDNFQLYTLPLPTGGPILSHILEICKNFNFTTDDFSTKEKIVLTYHRFIEASKFANGYRPYFCDPDFPKNEKQFKQVNEKPLPCDVLTTHSQFNEYHAFYEGILSPNMAKKHFNMIDEEKTHDITYYSEKMSAKNDHGTAHVAVLAENGDAVSATSSLNLKLGAHFLSDTLGILYNDQIGDSFTTANDEHKFSASEENTPRPFARPLSGMAPNIIIDKTGDVRMISGAAGGAKIPISVAWVIMMKFWFGMDLSNSMMTARFYNILYPNKVYEYEEFPAKLFISEGLKRKKHVVDKKPDRTIIQAIFRDSSNGKIYAKTDPRRNTRAHTDGY